MGNSNSSEGGANNRRPPLRSSLSASSTATVTSATYNNGKGKRRKSIELPDLNASLAFTPSASSATVSSSTVAQAGHQISPTNVKHKSKATVATSNRPVASAQHGEPSTPTASGPSSESPYFLSSRSNVPFSPDDSDIYLGGNVQDLQGENDKGNEIDDGARLTPSLRHAESLSVVATNVIPPVLETVIKDRSSEHSPGRLAHSPDPIPLPRNFSHAPSSNATSTSLASQLESILPPSSLPHTTIVAPEVPSSINQSSLGTAAGPTTSLIVGSPIGSATGTPVASPSLSTSELSGSILAPIDGAQGPSSPSSVASSPSIPLPAAAPLAVLTGSLANNPLAVEAAKAATVDLGAGPDGIPTLLTWTPGEGVGKEGGPESGDGMPQKVYVTGTFAKGWTTKIELRKKKSQTDFSALVNLPPGPHRLKFIVDKQWKTSRNLPSATDQDGNLINYLQVSVPGTASVNAAQQQAAEQHIDEEDYWQELLEQRWTTTIPEELISFGEMQEAEEAAYEAQDEHNRKLIERGLPPELIQHPNITPSHPNLAHPAIPPSLPAQLQRGVLNSIVLVAQGSGDDNSLLPKPDHSVIDHLAASPITKGLLSVGITKRYRKKFVTTVLYKPTPTGIV